MQKIKISGEEDYITLSQLLKYTGVISTGGQAKWYLSENHVVVNGEVEQRRGRKLYDGDTVEVIDHGTFVLAR